MLLTNTKTDVVIDETIDRIKTHAGFLRLYSDKDEILGDVPVYQINSIQIHGSKIDIPASLIKLCCVNKIPIHILTNLSKHYGSLHFSADKNIENRQNQYESTLDEKWRLYLAKQVLYQKILTQKRMCQLWNLSNDVLLLEKSLKKVNQKSQFQGLMGTEGQAATIYWSAFGRQQNQIQKNRKSQFEWFGRQKYPTKDPINSMLSLGYGLLSTQCQTSLTLQGFDPYLGILHKTNENRPALVYDIMEVYRCLVVDLWILGLLENKIFVPEDFTKTKEGVCTLFPHKKNEFFRLWFKRLKYYEFTTNQGKITLSDFLKINTDLLSSWFEKIVDDKERDTGRFNRFSDKMVVFKNIREFSFVE